MCKKAKSRRTIMTLMDSSTIQLNVILQKRFNFDQEREEFIEEYQKMHEEGKLFPLIQHLQLWFFKKIEVGKHEDVFRDIKTAEERLHGNAEECYLCILHNYGGESPVTERLCTPEGTAIDRLKKSFETFFSFTIEWYKMDIVFSFICLCSHIFDYIKDIGETLFTNDEE